MSNSVLTIDMVTREALRVLHQELRVIPKVRRDYDDRFARTGAKIGDTLRIRKPAKYVTTNGKTFVAQDTVEQYASLPVTSQKHIGVSFSSADQTLDLNSYSDQVLRPAMKQLAATVESDFITFVKNNTFWSVGNIATNLDGPLTPLFAGQRLNDSLAPMSPRHFVLNNLAQATLTGGTVSTLFNNQKLIGEQYRKGEMGEAFGFEFASTSLMPTHTNGTASSTLGQYVASGSSGTTLIADTLGNATTVTAGSVFTIADVYAVHPESKQNLGYLQQFVVTADALANSSGGGTASLTISPAPVATGAFQNVSAAPVDNALLTFVGAASATYGMSLAFHPDSFAFATVDLDMPVGGVEASRMAEEGLSLRVARFYDGVNDNNNLRIDILYGYCALYNQLAAKALNSPTYVAP